LIQKEQKIKPAGIPRPLCRLAENTSHLVYLLSRLIDHENGLFNNPQVIYQQLKPFISNVVDL
jgi:hypothetical protein